MALETGTFIDSLNANNPAITDQIDQGDDHIRLIKSTIKSTFPSVTGAVTLTHTQINALETRLTTAEANVINLNAGIVSNDADLATLDAGKANIAGDAFTGSISTTGDLTVSGNTILQGATVVAPAAADNSTAVPSTAWVTTELAAFTPLAGGTMTGELAMGDNKITGLGTPTADADASTKKYVDDELAALDTIPPVSYRSSVSGFTGGASNGYFFRNSHNSTNTITYTIDTPGNYVLVEAQVYAIGNPNESNEENNPDIIGVQAQAVVDGTTYSLASASKSGYASEVTLTGDTSLLVHIPTPNATTTFGFKVVHSGSTGSSYFRNPQVRYITIKHISRSTF